MCSTITLNPNGEIVIPQDYLYYWRSPGSNALAQSMLTILSVCSITRATERLAVSDVTIANGKVDATVLTSGGCIQSAGDMVLFQSAVSHCDLYEPRPTRSMPGAVASIARPPYSGEQHDYRQLRICRARSGCVGWRRLRSFWLQRAIQRNQWQLRHCCRRRDWSRRRCERYGTADIESSTISENSANIAGGL